MRQAIVAIWDKDVLAVIPGKSKRVARKRLYTYLTTKTQFEDDHEEARGIVDECWYVNTPLL